MKHAISIPDELVQQADRLARSTGKSRSELVSDALQEYIARHDSDAITQAMNLALDAIETRADEFVATASGRVLRRAEW